MKIYFTAAISLKYKYEKNYQEIVNILQSMGHEVIHEHISDFSQEDIKKIISKRDNFERIEYYKQVNHWIGASDLVVAELSFPSSLNVGHEVTLALKKGKHVIGLFLDNQDSHFFLGLDSEKFLYENYNEKNLGSVLGYAINYALNSVDVRFNMMLSPKLNNYLEEIAEKDGFSKAGFLRHLLLKHKNSH